MYFFVLNVFGTDIPISLGIFSRFLNMEQTYNNLWNNNKLEINPFFIFFLYILAFVNTSFFR